jgi:hypothetical protein
MIMSVNPDGEKIYGPIDKYRECLSTLVFDTLPAWDTYCVAMLLRIESLAMAAGLVMQ